MIIPIDDDYRIAGDKLAWMIQKSRLKKVSGEKEKVWESINWFGSLESAINTLCDLMVRTSEAQTLGDALLEVEKVSTKLSQALSIKFKVIREVKIDEDES